MHISINCKCSDN